MHWKTEPPNAFADYSHLDTDGFPWPHSMTTAPSTVRAPRPPSSPSSGVLQLLSSRFHGHATPCLSVTATHTHAFSSSPPPWTRRGHTYLPSSPHAAHSTIIANCMWKTSWPRWQQITKSLTGRAARLDAGAARCMGGVKEAVFPFARFGPDVDTVLGPEMKSTGEVMGIDRDYNVAFVKSQLGGGSRLPKSGTVFVSVKDADKARILEAIRLLAGLGFKVLATSGTQRYLAGKGVAAVRVNKVAEGRPHIVDAIKNGEVQLVFNTTEGATALADSRSLRRAALLHKVPYYTTLSGAVAAAQGIKAYLGGDLEVCALQNYFAAASDPESDQPERRRV